MKNTAAKIRTKVIQSFGRNPDQGKARSFGPVPWAVSGIFVFSWILATAVLGLEWSRGMEGREFIVGEPAPRTLFSPFELTYVNEGATESLQQEKAQNVPPVFSIDPSVFKNAEEKIAHFFEAVQDVRKSRREGSPAEAGQLPFEVSEPSLKFLLEDANILQIRETVRALLRRVSSQGVIDYRKKLELLGTRIHEITLLRALDGEESNVQVATLITPGETREFIAQMLPERLNKNRHLKNSILDIFNAVIASNLVPAEEETQSRRKKAAESAAPVQEKVKKNELLVQRGMLITPAAKEHLDRIQKKLTERKVLSQWLGTAILAGLAYFLCFIYLAQFQKKIISSLRMVILIHTIFSLTLILSKVTAIWPGSSIYLMPAALAPLLMCLLVNARAGFLSAAMMTILAAPLAEFQGDWLLSVLISGMAGVFGALQVRKRIHFLKAGSSVGLAAFFVLFSYRIFHDYPLVDSFQISALGLGSGLLITMPLCFLLLPLLESVFDLTTDITLLELSDLNHPLLKRMIVEAPGTYHHSLVVSTLAESAGEAIGANALLARVGCYFHDIGKIPRAEFFTENQNLKFSNKHEKLAPTMSSLVIMNHVKDGIALGRQYKLKRPILQFIPEHQGTGIIYYFYRKALDHAKPGERISPDDFRYPGPKPQSRETALALLADSTEAASRSLKDPSPESIRRLVRKIINDRFIDGQLDECGLTLGDLHRIQESFVYNLMAIFHTRVSYPPAPPDFNKPDLFEEDQFEKFRVGFPKRHF